jgi:hypothetical protein
MVSRLTFMQGTPTTLKNLEEANASVSRSHQLIDNIKNVGLALVGSLGEQNATLKVSQKNLLFISLRFVCMVLF